MTKQQDAFIFKRTIFFSVIFILFISCKLVCAAPVEDLFQEANQFYRDGKYAEAIRAYKEALKLKPSAEAYYNLGNAYFKDKKIGLAVLNYERAKQLAPRDSDIEVNLAYINRLIDYKIEDKRDWYSRKKSQLLSYVTFTECWVFALGSYFMFMTGFLILFLVRKERLFRKSGFFVVIFVIFSFCPLLLKYSEFGAGRRGVVTETQAEVRYGPSNSDRIAFRLVEGLEVSINDQQKEWYRIQLNDGRSGWVSQPQVTSI